MPRGGDKLTEVVRLRVSAQQLETLTEKARKLGITRSEMIRRAALGLRIRRATAQSQELIYHLVRIGNNLNQIARWANTSQHFEPSRHLDEILSELRSVLAEVRQLFRR